MPSGDDHPPRRNARSFDLEDSATKAAAWVWHLHESKPGVSTEGRFLSSQNRRRSSSSSDRKSSRFGQEAAKSSRRTKGGAMKFDRPTWDCGSNLYDTFELVAFGNRLDRSLMEVVPLTSAAPPLPSLQAHLNIPHEHHTMSPLHEPGGVLRTLSLPKSMKARKQSSKKKNGNTAPADANKASLAKSRELSFSVFNEDQAPKRWPSVEKLMKALKKVVVLHKQVSINVGCKQSIKIVEPAGQRPLKKPLSSDDSPSLECVGDDFSSTQRKIIKARRKSMDEELLGDGRRSKAGSIAEGESKPPIPSQNHHKHLHHHHHHHHHHYLHQTSLASESARLSPETMSQICTEKSWLA